MDVGPTTMNQIMHYCFKEIHLRRRDLNGKNQFGQLFIAIRLIDRRSRQGQRLSASMLSIYLLVCLSVCLSVAKMQKKRYFLKNSNLKLWSLLTTVRGTYVTVRKQSYVGFSKNPLLDP